MKEEKKWLSQYSSPTLANFTHLVLSDAAGGFRALIISMIVCVTSVICMTKTFLPLLPSGKPPANSATNTPDTTKDNRRTVSCHCGTCQSRENRASCDASDPSLNTRCNTPCLKRSIRVGKLTRKDIQCCQHTCSDTTSRKSNKAQESRCARHENDGNNQRSSFPGM
jgi:hypothetical protein